MNRLPHPRFFRCGLLLLAVLLLLGACNGTDVGNPADEGHIKLQFTALDPANALTLESGLVIDEAWLSFQELRFWKADDKGNCNGDDRIDAQGLFAVELVAGSELPAAPSLENISLDLCRLDFKLSPHPTPDLPEGSSQQLADVSLFISGKLPDGRTFSIAAPMNEVVSLKTSAASVKLGTDIQDLLVTFDFATWIDASTLEELQKIQGDVVEISAQNPGQQAILAVVQQNLKAAIKLNADTNADGRSQTDERATTLAAGEP